MSNSTDLEVIGMPMSSKPRDLRYSLGTCVNKKEKKSTMQTKLQEFQHLEDNLKKKMLKENYIKSCNAGKERISISKIT